MTISRDAVRTLLELEHGGRFNCIHSIARELISEGYAFDGWGKLEITEMGRRAARTFRSFTTTSDGVANMGDMNQPKFETPINSHGIEDPDPVILPDLVVRGVTAGKMMEPPDSLPVEPATMNVESKRGGETFEVSPQMDLRKLTWSRDRAMKAAGVANGAQEVWVGASWVRAFMEAYETIE